jgi:hypothetical protein
LSVTGKELTWLDMDLLECMALVVDIISLGKYELMFKGQKGECVKRKPVTS